MLFRSLGLTKIGTSIAIKEILIKYNLPWELPEIRTQAIIETISHDKKNIGGSMNLILIESIGNSFIEKIDKTKIENYLHKIIK